MTRTENKLTIALPSGSLQNQTLDLFEAAGMTLETSGRSLTVASEDPSLAARLVRPQEIGRYVERGKIDIGITGEDWLAETDARVLSVTELTYSKQTNQGTRWVLAVPVEGEFGSPEDLSRKTVATEVAPT